MSTEPRTTTVNLLTVQPLEISEPDWCAGHPPVDSDEARADFRVDISHAGPEHHLDFHSETLWMAQLTQHPFSTRPEDRGIGLYVEQGGLARTLTPVEVYELAAALETHADRLRDLADQLAVILEEDGGQ